MTLPQSLSVTIIAVMMVLFVWGRLRYDVVAALALLAAVACGLVPAAAAFKGFSDDIVIIVGSALVVSAAVARSGIVERLIGGLSRHVSTVRAQIALLVFSVAIMSAIVKNIGALAIMLPIAFQFARRGNVSPSVFLMPMAFASLLGGIVTLVGTSPNVIVARVRQELTGEPFGMFDFTPVGIGIALVGCLFLCVGYRLLPRDRRGAPSLEEALDIKDYATEAAVHERSELAGKTVSELRAIAQGEVDVVGILRGGTLRSAPLPDARLGPGDLLLLRGEPKALERVVAEGGLALEGDDRPTHATDALDPVSATEAIIGPDSPLAGQSAGDLALHARYRVNLLAVSRSGERFSQRLRDIRLRTGDIIVLQGDEALLPERLRDLNLLPLAGRSLGLGSARRSWIAGSVLAAAVLVVALGLLPVALAFFAAAVLMVTLRALPLRDAYAALEGPILVMLAALIPVSDTLRTTGMTEVLAGWLAQAGGTMPAWGALALIMAAAMAVTPFLNNAATVLVMAPIGAGFAQSLGYRPDAFLMAVAIGAACDFLTPIGHQCNTLVMGPGGYRFSDYPRLGAPLSLLVLAMAVPLILWIWPL